MQATFLGKHFSEREPSTPELSRSSTKREPRKRGRGLFSKRDLSDGVHLPVVRCDLVDAACFREASGSS